MRKTKARTSTTPHVSIAETKLEQLRERCTNSLYKFACAVEPHREYGDCHRELYDFWQQAEVNDIDNTLGLLPQKINGHDIRLVNVIHDELVFETGSTDTYSKIIEDTMIEGFLQVFQNAKDMTEGLVEAHTGQNWQEAK